MIPFTKAHACGNDFLIVTEEAAAGRDWAELARALCERNTGVGADGVEFFAWTKNAQGKRAGRIKLHNSDGSIAEISGNGTRCVAAWMAAELNSKPGDVIEIETDAGLRVGRIESVELREGRVRAVEVRTGMGVPELEKKSVRLSDGSQVEGMKITTGNPHFVIVVSDDSFRVAGRSWFSIGEEICHHADFPQQTNVEFVLVKSSSEIEIRIFERGVGPTTSSGTGSSASAAAAVVQRLINSPLKVVAPGGAQIVEWSGTGEELFLSGPAVLIAEGEAWL